MPLITRACISLSWVLIHSVATGEWPTFFEEMLALANNQIQSDDRPGEFLSTQGTYLILMGALAEEAKRADILEPRMQNLALTFLRDKASHVLGICHQILQTTQSVALRDSAITAINSWVELDPRTTDDIFRILDTLIQAAMAYPTAISQLTHVMEAIQSCLSNSNLHKFPKSLADAIDRFAQMRPIADKCIEEGDDESLSAFCSFLVFLSEDHSEALLARPAAVESICSTVCDLTNTQHPTLAAELMTFWQNFAVEVGARAESGAVQMYTPIILRFIQILHFRSRFPPAIETTPVDDLDDISEFRRHGSEALLFVYANVIGDQCLQILSDSFVSGLDAAAAALHHPEAFSLACSSLETTLYYLAIITENIPPSESVYVHRILDILSRVPNNVHVRRSALTFIGSLGSWLAEQGPDHPDYGAKIASYIIPSIVDEQLSQRASEAMRDLAREAPGPLVPHLGGLLSAIQNTLFQMPPRRRSTVISGLACVVALLDYENASTIFTEIARSLCASIQELLKLSTHTEESISSLNLEISSLGMSCASSPDLVGPHPFGPALAYAWPLIEEIAKVYIRSELVRRGILKCVIKFCDIPRDQMRGYLRGMLRICIEFARVEPTNPPVREIALLISRFATRPEGGIGRAGTDPTLLCTNSQDISDMCNAIDILFRTVFDAAQKTAGFSPEVLSSLFLLIHLALKRIPESLGRNQEFFAFILEAAIKALTTTMDRTAFSNVRKFIHGLYTFDDPIWRPLLVDGLAHGFKPLLQALFEGIGGQLSRSYLNELSGLFASLISRYPNELRGVATELLRQEGFPSPNVSMEEKSAFLEQLFRHVGNREVMGKLLYTFSGRCLGLKSSS